MLTASIYNGDHQNHIDNQTPAGCGGYSTTVTEMRVTSDPFPSGAESLASSLAGELERVRYVLNQMMAGNATAAQWYHKNTAQGDPLFAESFSL